MRGATGDEPETEGRRDERSSPRDSVVAVGLKRRADQVAEIARILQRLEIDVGRCALDGARQTVEGADRRGGAPDGVDGLALDGADGLAPDDAARIVLRLPAERVLEAVLALNYHGFADVRVYGGAA
ncbi:MAG TPA: hypothetical protein VNN07_17665 [Candidatus Tectomicrobia bacterium]|nr:hypothetical protein [Candidatus Tectomicrobia bacterium]